MKKGFKKSISLLLVLGMVMSMLSVTAFAVDTENVETVNIVATTDDVTKLLDEAVKAGNSEVIRIRFELIGPEGEVLPAGDIYGDIVVPSGVAAEIDLNGYVLGNNNAESTITNSGTLHLKNGTVTNNRFGLFGKEMFGEGAAAYAITNYGVMTVENVAVVEIEPEPDSGLFRGELTYGILNEGTMTLTGGNAAIEATVAGICQRSGELRVEGGNVLGGENAILVEGGTLTVGGTAMVGNGVNYAVVNNSGETAVISENAVIDGILSGSGQILVTGGVLPNYKNNIGLPDNVSVDEEMTIDENGKVIDKNGEVETIYLAEIVGGGQYETLRGALDNVTAGQTVKLLTNVDWNTRNGNSTTAIDVSGVTIDLNGYTLSALNHSLVLLGDFTLQNGTMDSKGGSYALFTGAVPGAVDSSKKAVVKNVTANGGINAGAAVELKDVTVNGTDYYAVWGDVGSNVMIQSGAYATNGNAVLGLAATSGSMTVAGGTFTTAQGQPLVLDNGAKPVITGGIFDKLVDEQYLAEDLECVESDGKYIVQEKQSQPVDGYVAVITSAYLTDDEYILGRYSSLQAAVDAWANRPENAMTIMLLTDCKENITIPSGQNVELTVRGFSLRNATAAPTITVEPGATLDCACDDGGIIKHTTGGVAIDNAGTVKLSGYNGTYRGETVLNNSGTATLSTSAYDGAVSNTGSITVKYGVKTTAVIESATIDNAAYTWCNAEDGWYVVGSAMVCVGEGETLRQYANLQTAIDGAANGETIILLNNISSTSYHFTVAEGQDVILNLNGKTLNGGSQQGKAALTNNGTLKITGEGTVTRRSTRPYATIENNGSLTIESGVYRNAANDTPVLLNGDYGTISISGGTFAESVQLYVAPGCVQRETDGQYTVTKLDATTAAASIETPMGVVYFELLQQAIDVANIDADGTVTLCNDVSGNFTIGEWQNITLNLNGKTLTGVTDGQATLTNSGTLKITGSGTVTHGGEGDAVANTGSLTVAGGTYPQDMSDYLADGCVQTAANNIYTVSTAVARIAGESATYFANIQDAVKAAQDGDVIEVLADVETTGSLNPRGMTITFRGVTKQDGTKPVISGKGFFSMTSADKTLTVENLELQIAENGAWSIYHDGGTLVIDNCDFTMGAGVTYTGNLVMGDGDTEDPLYFTNNTICSNSRAAIVSVGNVCVITGNTFDLMSENYGGGGRTSVISLTANAEGTATITGNIFKNANRVLAVDNSSIAAENLSFDNNKFINVRYAFELDPSKNAEQGTFDLTNNYYQFGSEAPRAARIENAAASGSHVGGFETEYAVDENSPIDVSEYYISEPSFEAGADNSKLLNTYVESVSLNSNTASLTVGATARLQATIVANDSARTATWTSSDQTVATVDENGVVTAVAVGTATITATVGDKNATCTVTVSAAPVIDPPSPPIVDPNPDDGDTDIDDPDVPLARPFLFTDVKEGDWFYDAVKYVFDEELMNGESETVFAPNASTTRGMIVTILYRLEGEPEATDSPFADVAAGQWYTKAVGWAAANGIVNGYDEDTFAPEKAISREELTAILYRYAAYKNYDKSIDSNALDSFPDASSVTSYAVDAMGWAVSQNIVTGKDGRLAPQAGATRAEVAQMLTRFCQSFVEAD